MVHFWRKGPEETLFLSEKALYRKKKGNIRTSAFGARAFCESVDTRLEAFVVTFWGNLSFMKNLSQSEKLLAFFTRIFAVFLRFVNMNICPIRARDGGWETGDARQATGRRHTATSTDEG